MFIIDANNNEATAVTRQTFAGLGFRERDHLQEWIAKNPAMLGEEEELLIIQKEFAGFDETRERLDLLALDKDGNLVIIENKRDDTGADVTWQALKYVSYCSTLTKEEIVRIFQQYLGDGKNAEAELRSFFGQDDFSTLLEQGDQRIILVAANFRKEVTSTVMWLFSRGIRIKCIKVTPYKHGENIFIDTEQIIPVKDAEEYLIKLAQKKQQESIATGVYQQEGETYSKFWNLLQQRMDAQPNTPFTDIKPRKKGWLWFASGLRGTSYIFSVWHAGAAVELYINRGRKELTNPIFDKLHQRKNEIESKFGGNLAWTPAGKAATIKYILRNVNGLNEGDWDKMIDFFVEYIPRFEAAMREVLNEVLADEPETATPEE